MTKKTTVHDIPSLFFGELQDRLWKLNANFIILITGGTGSGKSFYSLGLAQNTSKKPFKSSNILFSVEDLIKKLRNKQISKGDVVILEESGIGLFSRNAMSKANRFGSFLFQMMRFENFGIILNLPSSGMLDKNIRSVAHYHLTMHKIDRKNKQGYAKLHLIETDDRSGKIYRKFPQYTVDNECYRLKLLGMALPPKKLIEVYEKKKRVFAQQLYDKMGDEFEKMENDKKEKPVFNHNEYVAKVEKDKTNLLNSTKSGIDPHLLQAKFPELTARQVYSIKRIVETSHTHNNSI